MRPEHVMWVKPKAIHAACYARRNLRQSKDEQINNLGALIMWWWSESPLKHHSHTEDSET